MTVEGTSKITLNPENKHKGREGKTKTEFPSQGLEIMSHIFSSFPPAAPVDSELLGLVKGAGFCFHPELCSSSFFFPLIRLASSNQNQP